MPKIAPFLAVEAGVNYTELHVLDGGGRPQLIFELNPEQCRELSDQLQTIRPIEVVEVEAEEVDEEFTAEELAELERRSLEPGIPLELVAEQLELDFDPEPVGLEILPPEPTDWAALTKAEIVETVLERFGEVLDIHDLKDDLIHQAVELEQAGVA
jgi:hypothetical protein